MRRQRTEPLNIPSLSDRNSRQVRSNLILREDAGHQQKSLEPNRMDLLQFIKGRAKRLAHLLCKHPHLKFKPR